jgi:periplasmic protein TonB
MSVLALHQHADELGVRRYGVAAIAIVLVYAAVIAAALVWYQRPQPVGTSLQPILVELAAAPAAPKIQDQDLPPGPQVQEAETPPPEPPKVEKLEEQLPPTPLQPEAAVAAPPKEEAKPEKKAESPLKPQPVKQVKTPAKRLVEQKTAARADRVAPDTATATTGASAAAAAASYRATLVAHLQRFKRWPAGAEARGESGTALVNFVVARSGGVSGIRLAKSTGYASLDQEATTWIQRASPMPTFPADVRESSMSITAPLRWTPQR